MAAYKYYCAVGAFALLQLSGGLAVGQSAMNGPPLTNASRVSVDFNLPCSNPISSEAAPTPGGRPGLVPPKKDPAFPMSMPEYPTTSRQLSESGTVMLNIYVADQGFVSRARIAKSSGWPRLDEAALQHARNWRLIPATLNNKPACMWVTVPVVFDLRSYSAARLEATSIKPEAESLARLLFGGDAIAERLALETNGVAGTQEDMRARLFEAIMQQEEWHAALRDLAAMLSIEFSSDELAALNTQLRSPVARKFLAVHAKMRPEINLRQQRIQALGACIQGQIRSSTSFGKAGPDANNIMPAKFIDAFPRLVTELSPYCNCVTEMMHKVSNDALPSKSCGMPPKVSW
jgi:protein TonB